MSTKAVVTAVLSASIILSTPAARGDSTLEKGTRQYNAQQYQEAVNTLNLAVKQNKSDGAAHYQLANALLQTGDRVAALREYELGYSLSKTGTIAVYCQKAIEQLHHSSAASVQQSRYRSGRCPVGSTSHPDGVVTYPLALTAADGQEFIHRYDAAFKQEFQTVFPAMVPDWQDLTGTCMLHYSVDRKRQLRARVVSSDTDERINAACLEICRRLNGTQYCDFKGSPEIAGINFDHGVILKDMVAMLRGNAGSLNVSANRIPPGLSGKQQSLQSSTEFKSVAGKLISKKKKKQPGMQAKQLSLPENEIKKVSGQVMTKNAEGHVLPHSPAASEIPEAEKHVNDDAKSHK